MRNVPDSKRVTNASVTNASVTNTSVKSVGIKGAITLQYQDVLVAPFYRVHCWPVFAVPDEFCLVAR